jgi:hypothetical protein
MTMCECENKCDYICLCKSREIYFDSGYRVGYKDGLGWGLCMGSLFTGLLFLLVLEKHD